MGQVVSLSDYRKQVLSCSGTVLPETLGTLRVTAFLANVTPFVYRVETVEMPNVGQYLPNMFVCESFAELFSKIADIRSEAKEKHFIFEFINHSGLRLSDLGLT